MNPIFIILIVIGSAIIFVTLIALLKKFTKPKFTQNSYEYKKQNDDNQKFSGLSFSDSYISENPEYVAEVQEDEEEPIDYSKFKTPLGRSGRKKSLIQQINELSPEMKILLLDRVLARRDTELNLKSKKH